MGVYKKSVITEAGEALVARAVSGEVVIQFSHAKTSSYTYPEGTNFKKLTELQEVKQTVIPSNVQTANDTLISIRSMFDNSGITQDYLIQNVGIYVSDGETEILFAVCQATTPDQMPAFNGVAPSSFIYNIQISVAQAEQLSISINTAGAATVQDVLDLEKKMEEKKLDSSGGDISNTVVKNFETSVEEFPVPEPGEDLKTLWGKVRKFSGDIKAWMKGVCLLGHIVNNCVTNNPNLPLSAAQGKMLMDLYTVLNTKLSEGIQIYYATVSVTFTAASKTVGYCDFDIPPKVGWVPWIVSIGETENTDDRHTVIYSCSMRNSATGVVQAYNTWNYDLTHNVKVNVYYSRAW